MLKLNPTTYYQQVKADPEDEVKIIVGDDKQPDFKPQWKIERFSNEVNFSLRAKEEVGAKLKELPDGTIVYEAKDYEVHQYDKPDASEEGGFEFEWVLKKKPVSNVLTATIQSKGLSFYFQPPLTPEEIAEGEQRPDNVIGSYAVYHSTKSNHKVGDKNYKCGKAFHIYRPKAIDAKGVEVWADLNIDEARGLLTVTVPQSFLDSAVYPVRVDPTFGYTTAGGSQVTGTGRIRAKINSPAGAGTIDSVSVCFHTDTAENSKTALYLSDGSSILTPQSEEKPPDAATPTFTVFSFISGPSITVQDYAISVMLDTNTIRGDAGGVSGNSKFLTKTYGAWDSSVTFTNTTSIYSIYATYTASGGSAIKTINGLAYASVKTINGLAIASVKTKNGLA